MLTWHGACSGHAEAGPGAAAGVSVRGRALPRRRPQVDGPPAAPAGRAGAPPQHMSSDLTFVKSLCVGGDIGAWDCLVSLVADPPMPYLHWHLLHAVCLGLMVLHHLICLHQAFDKLWS